MEKFEEVVQNLFLDKFKGYEVSQFGFEGFFRVINEDWLGALAFAILPDQGVVLRNS